MRTTLTAILFAALSATTAHAAAPSATNAAKAQQILAKRIPAYYGNSGSVKNDFGIVKELGRAKLTATKNPNIVRATVHFDGNELWGGDNHYKVSVDVNLKTKLIKPLGQPVATKVIN